MERAEVFVRGVRPMAMTVSVAMAMHAIAHGVHVGVQLRREAELVRHVATTSARRHLAVILVLKMLQKLAQARRQVTAFQINAWCMCLHVQMCAHVLV